MEKEVILYKLQKYQTKLNNNPNNIIYQQKVTYYGSMIGGDNWVMQKFNNITIYTRGPVIITESENNFTHKITYELFIGKTKMPSNNIIKQIKRYNNVEFYIANPNDRNLNDSQTVFNVYGEEIRKNTKVDFN